MLDGASQWIELRADQLSGAGARAEDLQANLLTALKAINGTRDELDDNAQVFVKALADIDKLDKDMAKNINQIQTIANHTATVINESELIKHTKQTVATVLSLK